jgi:hypothetical protein
VRKRRVPKAVVGAKLTWESVVDVGTSSSSFPGNGARKEAAGAKLTWESIVDVGTSSSSLPGNGARKLCLMRGE